MNLEFSQIIIQIIAFLIMLWILKRYGWQPLLNLLNERHKKIQSEFDTIAAQKEDNRKVMEEYQAKLRDIDTEARHKIQEAVAQGRKIAMEIQEETQAKSKEILAKAKVEIDKEIAEARDSLKNGLVNTAFAIAEKILHKKIDSPEHRKLISNFVKETELK
jgi:F-type H+-transporting ATPase subunit b